MSLTRRVAYNTIFQILGKVIVTALSLFIVAILTRFLGVSGYGEYTIIFTYVSFWAILADFGFFWVLVREISKPNSNQEEIFDNIVTLKALFGLVVFLICSLVGFFIPQYTWTIKLGIALISASWFWMSLNSTYVGLLQSKLEMYKASISEIIGRLIIALGVYFLVRTDSGLYEILWIYILGNIVNFIISYYFGSKYIKFHFRYNPKMWWFIFKESTPLAILGFVGMIHFKIDTVILSLMKGPIDVGIYGVPYKILEIIILLPGIFMGNVFPILTNYFHSHDKRFESAMQRSSDFLLMMAFPVVAGLIILAFPIIRLVAGQEYLTASTINVAGMVFSAPQIMIILSFSIAITFLLTIYSNLLTIIGKQNIQVKPMIVITIINVILNLIFIPRYSYVASAIITVVTEFIMFIWWAKLTHKHLHFALNYKIIPKIIVSTLVMSLAVFYARDLSIFLSTAIGIITYFVFGYIIKMFDKDTIQQLMSFNKNKNLAGLNTKDD